MTVRDRCKLEVIVSHVDMGLESEARTSSWLMGARLLQEFGPEDPRKNEQPGLQLKICGGSRSNKRSYRRHDFMKVH